MAEHEESRTGTILHAQAVRNDLRLRYAGVAHLLSESQRREMRRYLAQMTVLVREIENERPTVRLAMARASSAAPLITDAVLKSR